MTSSASSVGFFRFDEAGRAGCGPGGSLCEGARAFAPTRKLCAICCWSAARSFDVADVQGHRWIEIDFPDDCGTGVADVAAATSAAPPA